MTREVRVMISETQIVARILNSQTEIDRSIDGIPELKPDTMTLADRRGNPTDLEVKVLVIFVGSIVDAKVFNLIIDSKITAIDSVVRRTDEVEKLAYQLNEEAERTERPIRRLSKVMYGSTCADMQVDVMGECLSSIKHVVGEQLSGGSVSPRGTTPADDRYIVLQTRRNRRQTAGEIARHTTQATGRPISRFTVVRRLHGGGLFAQRPVRCVPLTPAHRRRRSLWSREHRNWRDNEWGGVLFTDESRFSLSSDSHRILIWRERGSHNHPSNIIERDRYGCCGVLRRYGSAVPFHGRHNAPCHCTVAAEQLLESEDIERMDWLARSLDLNPIEHVWDFLGSSYLTTSNDSGASIGAARRMGSNASTTH
ncbi:transposable element Tcb1 transposase [Trichonephila clavipes]|nr:transposable element Tcb1 transposase [Trichonephila clavipes]